MPTVNMHEAKSSLSKLVETLENGEETEIVLARNGKPVARIVPIGQSSRIIGIADGEFGELGEQWFQDTDDQRKILQDVMEARWERFERFSRELDEKSEKKKRKKSA